MPELEADELARRRPQATSSARRARFRIPSRVFPSGTPSSFPASPSVNHFPSRTPPCFTFGTEASRSGSSRVIAPRSAACRNSSRTALSRWLTDDTDKPRASSSARQASTKGFDKGSPRSAVQDKKSAKAVA